MHNFVLSPIDPETLINSISDRVTANILKAVEGNNPTPEPQDQLLTIQEAAKLLHLSIATLYSKVSRRELPGVCKQGKRLYFERDVLLAWIKEGRKVSNTEIEAAAEAYVNKKGGNNG